MQGVQATGTLGREAVVRRAYSRVQKVGMLALDDLGWHSFLFFGVGVGGWSCFQLSGFYCMSSKGCPITASGPVRASFEGALRGCRAICKCI